jgi:hypothetical protein
MSVSAVFAIVRRRASSRTYAARMNDSCAFSCLAVSRTSVSLVNVLASCLACLRQLQLNLVVSVWRPIPSSFHPLNPHQPDKYTTHYAQQNSWSSSAFMGLHAWQLNGKATYWNIYPYLDIYIYMHIDDGRLDGCTRCSGHLFRDARQCK